MTGKNVWENDWEERLGIVDKNNWSEWLGKLRLTGKNGWKNDGEKWQRRVTEKNNWKEWQTKINKEDWRGRKVTRKSKNTEKNTGNNY